MNNPPINKEIWTSLRQKWATLVAISKVEFTVLKDPEDSSRELAIDVAQNINGEWGVRPPTTQNSGTFFECDIVKIDTHQIGQRLCAGY